MIKTLSVRVRDKHAKVLNQMAFEANQVWNAVNAFTSEFAYVPVPEVGYIYNHFSAFDLQKKFKTLRKERGLSTTHSTTVQEVMLQRTFSAIYCWGVVNFKTKWSPLRNKSSCLYGLGKKNLV